MTSLLEAGSLAAFVVLLAAAAWQDLRTLRIDDRLSIAIAATFMVWALSGLAAGNFTCSGLGLAAASAAGLLGVGVLAFAFGVVGGGDVKLLTATSLFAGPGLMLDFVTGTALVGGLLGVAILAGVPIGPGAPGGDATIRGRLRGRLPYGPAIAAGGLGVAVSLALR